MEGRIGSEELRSWEEAMGGSSVELLGKGDLGDQEKERLRWKQPRDRLIMPGGWTSLGVEIGHVWGGGILQLMLGKICLGFFPKLFCDFEASCFCYLLCSWAFGWCKSARRGV